MCVYGVVFVCVFVYKSQYNVGSDWFQIDIGPRVFTISKVALAFAQSGATMSRAC